MPKQVWNAFINNHPTSYYFCAGVLSQGPPFDKNHKKLPSPYGLFQEWASSNLISDWASVKISRGFIISVVEASDVERIKKKFGYIGLPKWVSEFPNTQQIGYSNSDYGNLAKSMGYKFWN